MWLSDLYSEIKDTNTTINQRLEALPTQKKDSRHSTRTGIILKKIRIVKN